MTDFEIANTNFVATPPAYVVSCWTCAKPFDVESSTWCACESNLRTLDCPRCGSCFCRAPLPYKRNFWNGAPTALREHRGRFRVAATSVTAPEVQSRETSSPLHQPYVLIVDDEEPLRSLAACYVEQAGYRVATAAGAEEALLMTDQIAFDVVLTDALMPKMDGRELSRRLKETHGPRLKVILMTALYTARRFQTEARNMFKVDVQLAKPLRFEALRDALHKVAPLGHAGRYRERPAS